MCFYKTLYSYIVVLLLVLVPRRRSSQTDSSPLIFQYVVTSPETWCLLGHSEFTNSNTFEQIGSVVLITVETVSISWKIRYHRLNQKLCVCILLRRYLIKGRCSREGISRIQRLAWNVSNTVVEMCQVQSKSKNSRLHTVKMSRIEEGNKGFVVSF